MFMVLSRFAATLRRRHAEASGQALVLFGLGLAGLCGLVGMSVDIGALAYQGAKLQSMVDAAALAGAQDLAAGTPNTSAATTSATSYFNTNGSAQTGPFGAVTPTIAYATSSRTNDTITVSATRRVDFQFLKVLGIDHASTTKTATVRTTAQVVTGYAWNNVAPFVIWGGTQQKPVNADKYCPYHTCVGKSYTFWSNSWLRDSGTPIAPDWTASNSNNFKGDVQHGAGATANEIGDFFSDGGNGSAVAPAVGSILVLPLIDKGADGSSLRKFHIVAWVLIKVDAGCNKGGGQPCTGTILSPATTTPPAGYDSNGSVQPPPGLTYSAYSVSLTK